MTPIKILLADDHTLVRAGIRALLQKINNVRVVGEAETGTEALTLVEQLQPDLVLMDIAMPGLGGLEATSLLTQKFPNTRVIILSMHMEQEYVLRALQAGANSGIRTRYHRRRARRNLP
jgi:DNA-binding NarL/FixJ family response regulator